MAAVVIFRTLQHEVGIRVTPGADDVVHSSAIVVPAIPGEGVMGDGGHGPEARQVAP